MYASLTPAFDRDMTNLAQTLNPNDRWELIEAVKHIDRTVPAGSDQVNDVTDPRVPEQAREIISYFRHLSGGISETENV